MLMRKDIFGEDTDMFRPERYLECSKETKVEMERTLEMAFGVGRYQCSGKVIALAEIYKVVFEVGFSVLCRLQKLNLLTMGPGLIVVPSL